MLSPPDTPALGGRGGGGWRDVGRDGGVHGGGRVSGLRAQLSLSQEAHPLGAAALITGGSSPCVSSLLPGTLHIQETSAWRRRGARRHPPSLCRPSTGDILR